MCASYVWVHTFYTRIHIRIDMHKDAHPRGDECFASVASSMSSSASLLRIITATENAEKPEFFSSPSCSSDIQRREAAARYEKIVEWRRKRFIICSGAPKAPRGREVSAKRTRKSVARGFLKPSSSNAGEILLCANKGSLLYAYIEKHYIKTLSIRNIPYYIDS